MLTAVILFHDETSLLPKCLSSVSFADEILIVVDGPTTTLPPLPAKPKVKAVSHHLKGDFAAHRNFALSRARGDWVLFVDSDEQVSPELSGNIRRAVGGSQADGYLLHRVDYLWNHRFRYGDLAGVNLLRLGRKSAGKWVGRVHETWQISGSVRQLAGDLLHTPHPTLYRFLQSLNTYSSIRARELFDSGTRVSVLSFFTFPAGKFIYLWLFKLGFLDGFAGLVHALAMSFYSFLVRGKLYLLSKGIDD